MTLEELAKIPYNRLLLLERFTGWVKSYGWTGRYYYEGILDNENEKYLVVEIRTGVFTKKFINISLLREIKEYQNVRKIVWWKPMD